MKIDFKIKEIPDISQKILNKILKDDNHSIKILALSGDLGSGKTTLTKEIAKHLNIKENIISPTFVIMKAYNVGKKSDYYPRFKKLIHIDAYRLDSYTELLKIGWEKLIEDEDTLIILEWPQIVKDCLNKEAVTWVYLKHKNEETRSVEF